MALLLKIKSSAIIDGRGTVPIAKSSRLTESDIGENMFIWLDDLRGQRSALRSVATLLSFELFLIPQVRDPSKTKQAYRVRFAEANRTLVQPLSTDDLEPFRYSEGDSGIERLGRLHRDRNDKIIRLSDAETDTLAARFQS